MVITQTEQNSSVSVDNGKQKFDPNQIRTIADTLKNQFKPKPQEVPLLARNTKPSNARSEVLKKIRDFMRTPELQKGGNISGYAGFGVKANDNAAEYACGGKAKQMCGGGKTKSMQQGGQVSDDQFPAWLAQVFGVQSEQELQQVAQQLGDDGIKQLYQAYKQGASPEQVRQSMQQAQSRKNGGIIEYYKRLNNL